MRNFLPLPGHQGQDWQGETFSTIGGQLSKRPCQILEPALFQETATIPSPPPPPQLHAFSFPDRRFFPREARNTLPWPVLLPAPSLYVVVAVAKHGCGMDRAIVETLPLSLSLASHFHRCQPPLFYYFSGRIYSPRSLPFFLYPRRLGIFCCFCQC